MAKRKTKTELEITSNEQQNKEIIENKENKETTEIKKTKENKEVVIKKSIGEGVYIRKLRRL